ncbi:MAG: proteasome assembly chaperone family protein [Candidatus Micrarchaeota archaeon]|nr:proteasome assembly chaperone family protein [Candidatus Micrarchaeota archaeon]
MKETKIYYKKTKLSNPVLFVGLPGIGSIGSLVAEHLKKELKAKRFATLYSPHFPYQIIMLKDGSFRLVSNRFYYAKGVKGKSDVVILLGDAQPLTPEGQYEVNERIVEFFKHLGGTRIYTIGGYSMGTQYVKEPKVFGLATDAQTVGHIKKYGVTPTDATGMSVLGSAGMIVAFSKMHRMSAACIMGETGMLDVDANSAKAVLQVIGKLLGMEISLSSIEKLKGETEKMLKELEEPRMQPFPPEMGGRFKGDPSYIR